MSGFWFWWQHIPEHLDPYLIRIGSFGVGYYGLMYLVGFLTCYLLALYRIRNERFEYSKLMLQDYIVWAALGIIIGARVGYVLIYNLPYYVSHPLEIILPFQYKNGFRFTGISGMSYHGGLVGMVVASFFFFRKRSIGFWRFADFFVPVIPMGYMFGRIGNFINGELYGRATEVPWGMYFPLDSSGQLRHPSQLYEASFEGLFLFAVLWSLRRKTPFEGFMLGMYLVGYGIVRFFIEFFRQPDAHIGFVLGPFSMGQLLCMSMMAVGIAILSARYMAHAKGR